MSDIRTRLRQAHDTIVPPPDVMGALIGRRKRAERRKRDRRRKVGSVIVGILVVGGGVSLVVHEMARPASDGVSDGDPIPGILPDARLAPGSHQLSVGGLPITFTVPDGWRGAEQGVVDSEYGPDGPRGAAVTFWTVSNVYEDACRWRGSAMEPPIGPSVTDLVRALATQNRHPSGPRISTDVKGYPATELEMTVPSGLDLSACDSDEFRSWQSPTGDRYHQGAGQIDHLFIVNVHGTRIVIDVSYFPDTSEQDRSEALQMFRSAEFG